MMTTAKVPLEKAQSEQLEKLFATPGWLTLREVLSAHCSEAQVEYLDASMYQNENAEDKATSAKAKAISYNVALDILDLIQSKKEEWYRITVETRR